MPTLDRIGRTVVQGGGSPSLGVLSKQIPCQNGGL